MKMKFIHIGNLVLALILMTIMCLRACAQPDPGRLKLPDGFEVSIYCDKVPGARQMVLSPEGTLYVGTIGPNKVYAIPDRNKDGKPDKVVEVASGFNRPNGVAIRDGALFVAEINQISRYDNIEAQVNSGNFKSVVVNKELPDKAWHGYKYIRFGPDGLLYAPVGAPCNVCEKEDKRFGTILTMKPDGTDTQVYASGVRNTVGFDWHPQSKELWFTDNGRDYLGDNLPPDELNHATKKGLHFGFPYRYGMNVPDPEFGHRKPDTSQFTPPAVPLGPHVAALGMRFYTGDQFPQKYRNTIFICEHGSWNRTKKIGYRITNVTFKPDGKPDKYEVFCDGFKSGEDVWGRPVDLCIMPDGSMLVSDDAAGVIYRITYKGGS